MANGSTSSGSRKDGDFGSCAYVNIIIVARGNFKLVMKGLKKINETICKNSPYVDFCYG